MDWQNLNLEVIISAAALLIAFWRMNVWSVKRTDQMFSSLRADMSQMQGQIGQLQIQIGQILEKIGHMQGQFDDLRSGQQEIHDSISDLNSRVSDFEGLIQRRPWIEVHAGDLPPSPAAQP